ncbi:enoyl-CoA hydratase-related protein [Sphingomonas sp. BIUV-7]|uniref:Enoyl-CoA hydratase-related protein n=1 Tax=Sphingomonas natans TaxID=3063330 RepID=A0ABT8Y837_9SPHN|nr:enoyl-CoA hydratase-related protein [Sphingomonas sp. BIUV-7]MDO6414481.1 enoyl-CoA hydratase-related protein [Sphingomonas sp. BIUV-7]
MTFETLRYAVDDGIGIVTLARPERLNAVNGAMIRDLLTVLDRVDADDDVRALIITGEGRAFCAGADLSRGTGSFVDPASAAALGPGGKPDYGRPEMRDGGGIVALRLYALLKPVIAAINGPAVGLGITLTLPMDIRLASSDADFRFVFGARGMVPEAASGFFLPRLVGISTALEWCYASRTVTAADALDSGLVRAVYPSEELLGAARRLAADCAAGSAPVSAALIRHQMWRGLAASHPMDAHRIDSRGIAARSRSADAIEGVAAWQEKRSPIFGERVSRDMPDFFPWWEEPDYR